MKPRFLFILSPAPRCGTNFLFDVLTLCPLLSSARIDEDHFISEFATIETFLRQSLAKSSLSELRRETLMKVLERAISQALLEAVSSGPGATEGDHLTVFKTPTTLGLSAALSTFPDSSRFLVIVRDGRDVIESSVLSFPWFNFAYVFHRWRSGCEALFEAEAAGSGRLKRVRYEDLLNDPGTTIREVFGWLGLPTDAFPYEQVALLPVRGSSESRLSNGEVSWLPTREPLAVRPDARASEATPLRRCLFRAIGDPWNARLGYSATDPDRNRCVGFFARLIYLGQSLRYRLRPSMRRLASDLGGPPPLFP